MAVAELVCPTCGGDLRYIQEYDRHYCYDCNNYAPEGYGGGQGLTCPKCGGVLSFIRDHNRYFCHRDDEYMPPEFGRNLISSAASAAIVTPPSQEAATPSPAETHEPKVEPPIPADLDELFPVTTRVTPEELPGPEPSRVLPQREETPSTPAANETTSSVVEPVALPPLIRSELWKAKKSVLIDLCRAYGLSVSGAREALRDRLLSKLSQLDKEKERAKSETPVEPSSEVPPRVPSEPSPPVEPSTESEVSVPEARVAEPPEPEAVKIIEAPRMPEDLATKPKEAAASTVASVPVAEARPEPAPSADLKAPEPRRDATVAPQVPAVVNPCPTCGRELTYVKPYDRYYCMHCKTYAPPVVKVERIAPPARLACPTCGRELTFIAQFGRHYCYHCQKYAPPASAVPMAVPAKTEVRIEVPRAANACPTCGRELRYIQQYGRWYCDACGKYAPKRAKRPCPSCAGELRWIPRYRRYYCYSCNQYAPAAFPPPAMARLATASPAGAATQGTAASTRAVERPRQANASNAIGLAAMGVVMYVMYAIFAVFPAELGVPSDLALTPGMAFALQFIALFLLAVGTVWGLWTLNLRK